MKISEEIVIVICPESTLRLGGIPADEQETDRRYHRWIGRNLRRIVSPE